MFIITANQDIILTRGDTATIDIRVTDGAGEYIVQKDDNIVFSVRKSVDSPVLISKNGQSITLEPEDTMSLPNGRYVFDVTITQANGAVSTIISEKRLIIGAEV